METITKKFRIGLLHLGFWLLYLFLLSMIFNFMVMGKVGPNRLVVQKILAGFLLMPALVAYVSYYFGVFKFYTQKRNYLSTFLLALGISLGIGIVLTYVLEVLLNAPLTWERFQSVTFSLILFQVFHCTVVGGIAFIVRAFHQWVDDQALKQELQRKNHQMQLELVKAQLDPHFLFNSLNNIDVLIQQNAEKASAYLNMLSDLLRHSLQPNQQERNTLKAEVDLMKKYVELQKIRSSNEKLVDFEVKEATDHLEIAPSLLLPFLENAFKYHAHRQNEVGIHIRLETRGTEIHFQCSNRIATKQNTAFNSFKIGNELIQQRLELLYPSRHELTVDEKDDIYTVSLILR